MARKGSVKSVEVKLYAPQANRVNLAGDFNKWQTNSISAKKDSRGTWYARLNLAPGRYEYKFVVDGNWQNDPGCKTAVSNAFGSQNNVLIVS